jgi:sigma-E factor negative regulatory protein RseA
MNAAHDNHPLTGITRQSVDQGPLALGEPGSDLSAMVDGELDVQALDALLKALAEDEDVRTTCMGYQVIGDVLRGGVPRPSVLPPHTFVAGVRARLLADLGSFMPPPAPIGLPVRAPAANDAVFRWKMVAGVASLAAIMAVSWSVIGVAPASSGGAAAGPQLALLQSPAGVSLANVVQPADQPTAVVVNTAQGPVLRDARLEQLLAEHRQYGGMSALQMPAGFLRDATHTADPQR